MQTCSYHCLKACNNKSKVDKTNKSLLTSLCVTLKHSQSGPFLSVVSDASAEILLITCAGELALNFKGPWMESIIWTLSSGQVQTGV